MGAVERNMPLPAKLTRYKSIYGKITKIDGNKIKRSHYDMALGNEIYY